LWLVTCHLSLVIFIEVNEEEEKGKKRTQIDLQQPRKRPRHVAPLGPFRKRVCGEQTGSIHRKFPEAVIICATVLSNAYSAADPNWTEPEPEPPGIPQQRPSWE